MDISLKTVSSHTDVSSASIVPPAKEHGESEENCESDERPDHDEVEGDDDEDDQMTTATAHKMTDNAKHTRKLRNVVRRENLRRDNLDNSMIVRKKGRYANNYRINKSNGNAYEKDNGDAGANDSNKYCCPICGVNSPTQHEFTEHIRGHNNADGNQNFTCRICFKVSICELPFILL